MSAHSKKMPHPAIGGLTYALTSNGIAAAVGIAVTLILPKYLGMANYGIFQLYTLYTIFVGFLHFGLCDGIYLRYGGQLLTNLPKKILSGQFILLAIFQIAICTGLWILVTTLSVSPLRANIITAVLVTAIILNLRQLPLSILQATGEMRRYALIITTERFVYLLLILSLLLLHQQTPMVYVWANVIAGSVSLMASLWLTRAALTLAPVVPGGAFREAWHNVTSGIGLMLANLASLGIIGAVRYAVEQTWGFSTFGQVSLVLNVVNLWMIFLNAAGLVFFPLLRRADPGTKSTLFSHARIALVASTGVLLATYDLIAVLLRHWLPQFTEISTYLVILFPVIVFEASQALVQNTYFKDLRRERTMFVINAAVAAAVVALALLAANTRLEVTAMIAVIPLAIAARSVISTALLGRLLSAGWIKSATAEVGVCIAFWATRPLPGVWPPAAYLMLLIIGALAFRRDIGRSLKTLGLTGR